jgi:hypothetical protein
MMGVSSASIKLVLARVKLLSILSGGKKNCTYLQKIAIY